MIELTRLQKLSGATIVLDIESFTLPAGEIAAIVGPVGSGKTELLKLILGQSRPTLGSVNVCGFDPVRNSKKLAELVGVVFAENGLYERLSARENLRFHCRLRGLPLARADEVLAEVGLADHANTPVPRLPASLARRLAFGRAALHRPRLLLLVDPFTGCEMASCLLLSDCMRQAAAEGTAILILVREGVGLANLAGAIYSLEAGKLSPIPLSQDALDVKGNNENTGGATPFKIPARQEGRVVLVTPADLLYASAEEEQTCLHTLQGDILSHLSMSELEERLARNGFFRAHRSYLVNLQRVKAIIPYTRDSFTLILDDPANTEIPLSRNAAKELRELLGY